MNKLNVMKSVLLVATLAVSLGATVSATAAGAAKHQHVKSAVVKGDWFYDSSSLDRKYASLESDNGFKFPDSESSNPTTLGLELFDFGGNYEFRLTNRDAEFTCPSKGPCTILVSFDGGKKKKVEIEFTDGLDERHVNAKREEYKDLFTALKSAKTMTIDASFAGVGVKSYKFRVGGLKWPSPK